MIGQVGSYKLTGKRMFRMAPLHHHFEMKGWGEVTIVVRFWIIQGLLIGAGWHSSMPNGFSPDGSQFCSAQSRIRHHGC